ncbi:hypothetical protein BUL40_06935 [Croceivirga radicis]|uniref:Calcineurin-like phosphoesterase domain-containing protein n=1 Tax=Croceivirga radicis TaxID=1929488 RepID=A0A1V6LRN2_9FLAO|nr:metallophosphoesterase [Croceivirga radicis]OQD42825.1 hypothetical protein BUL40_06935 [Croceivirga radicis]
MERRTFVKQSTLFCASTLVLPLKPGLSNTQQVRIGLASDTHYAERKVAGTRYYAGALQKMEEFVNTMNTEQVDFVMHLGDFKDEDETKSEANTLGYLQTIEAAYAKFNGPRYHCIGNHDVDSITKTQFLEQVTNTGVATKKGYYSFDANGFHFVVLDGNHTQKGKDHFYKTGQDWQDTNLGTAQLTWLAKDLAATALPVVAFCHHPLYEFFRDGHKYHVNDYKAVQKLLEVNGNVLAVFQGHVHAEDHVTHNGIHYVTVLGMVDFEGLDNNSFSLLEIKDNQMVLKGYKRSNSFTYSL